MLLRHTLLYLPAQLLAPLAQFAAAVAWTHWMSPTQYGVLTFLIAAQELVFVVSLSWWSAFCLRYFAGFDGPDMEQYRRSEATVLALTMLIGAVAGCSLLAYLRLFAHIPLTVVTIVFLSSRSVNVHFAERARAQELIGAYTIAQTAGPLFGFGLALLAVHFVQPTPTMALAGFAVAQTVAALVLVRRLGIDLTVQRPDATMLRRAVAYGMPMVIGGALGWISLNAVRIVVGELGGDEAMGLLAVGWSLGQRLAGVTAMLVTAAAFPLAVRRLATHSRADALKQFGTGGTLLFGVVAPAAIGLWQIGPTLVELLVAAPFRDVTLNVLPAAILAGAVRNLRVHYADQSLLLAERTNLGVIVNAGEACAVVVAAIAGWELGGIPGAVQGCLVATIFAAVAAFAVARRTFGLPLPLGWWGRIAISTAAMALAVHLVRTASGSSLSALVLQVAAGGIVYLAMMALLFARELRELWPKLALRNAAGPVAIER